MNERIKELELEATEPPRFPANIGYFNKEKFAELIVRECITVVNQTVSGKPIEDLKEHFGVK